MYIRCPDCGTCTRIWPGNMRGATCASCGRTHSLGRADRLGSTPAERYGQAEKYAMSEGIDLASAYSVLLGIMPRERAVSTRGSEGIPAPPGRAASAPVPGSSNGLGFPYDPEFRDAVANGYLTIRQAAERGDRVFYASRLIQRHGLSAQLAFFVADNRMQLAEAIKRQAAANAPAAPPGADTRRGSRVFAVQAAVVVALFAGSIWWGLHGASGGPTTAAARSNVLRPVNRGHVPTVQTSSEVRTDPAGQVTGIKALDPQAVLERFCQSSSDGDRREPVRVAPTEQGDQLGIFRQGGMLHAIPIRKDEGTGSWVAGNDLDPIAPVDVPPGL